jgi:hypothetical protein
MLEVEKMSKETQFKSGATMDPRHKNGKLSISTKLIRLRPVDSAKTSVSKSTSLSTLYLNLN